MLDAEDVTGRVCSIDQFRIVGNKMGVDLGGLYFGEVFITTEKLEQFYFHEDKLQCPKSTMVINPKQRKRNWS